MAGREGSMVRVSPCGDSSVSTCGPVLPPSGGVAGKSAGLSRPLAMDANPSPGPGRLNRNPVVADSGAFSESAELEAMILP